MNILILTSNYPADDIPKQMTSVVHYFAKEWVRKGHRVVVLHSHNGFPFFVYWILKLFRKRLESKVGYMFTLSKPCDKDYNLDGVVVHRRIMTKLLPHFRFFDSSYRLQICQFLKILDEDDFKPDVIIGHWITPQLRLMHELKKIYNVPTMLTIHEELPVLERDYGEKGRAYLQSIDKIGFRSGRIKQVFLESYPLSIPTFMCYSGVPTSFVPNKNAKNFHDSIRTFTYTGTLIARKCPEALLWALKDRDDSLINIIGDGEQKQNLMELIDKFHLADKVKLWGRIERDQVNEIMRHTDCFIMISKFETFGLVYLEAMANGCITIASRGEGMDGVIKDGFNGFLCEAGNWKGLKEIIHRLDQMSREELQVISNQAYATAKRLTDDRVADEYLNFVKSGE